MTPEYRVIANQKDITPKIQDRLISLEIEDEAGNKSDRISIELDNRDGILDISSGAEVEVFMGYKESGVARMGLYIIDSVAEEGPPEKIIITGNSANMREGLKELKERTWRQKSLGDIVTQISVENGYKARISPELFGKKVCHMDQTESDIHFLTRIAKEQGAIAKVAGGFIIFIIEGSGKSVTGRNIKKVHLDRKDFSSWRGVSEDRKKYKSVMAYWQDKEGGDKKSVKVGKGYPQKVLMDIKATPEAAKTAAIAAFKKINRRGVYDFSCSGRTDLMAETPLKVSGISKRIDGEWTIASAKHSISSAGYCVRCTAKPPPV